MQEYSTIAAVDLGSNSFRLQVARVVGDQVYPLDSLREAVRLGAGLTTDKLLDDDSQERALACLRLFGERLRGLPPHAVRVVGTNTFRVAKNAAQFLRKAEEALGFPVEVVAGREEARLIYLGVSHELPAISGKRLVVDIGGGSTEFIIGHHLTPRHMESLYMGCVSFSRRFFPDGKITRAAINRAEIAVRTEVQTIAAEFRKGNWDEAVGSSGTARALSDVLEQRGYTVSGITAEGLDALREELLRIGDSKKLAAHGVRPDRIPVLPGGFAIMAGLFAELEIQQMRVSDSAMREGVLYDLIGRFSHQDMRDITVRQFMQRYQVDGAQARRVEQMAHQFMSSFSSRYAPDQYEEMEQHLGWAASLHELGISIAHSGYHRHGAYIIENADMPGFSRTEQRYVGFLIRAQRGNLVKSCEDMANVSDWCPVVALRLSVLFCRNRMDSDLPVLGLQIAEKTFALSLPKGWLKANPLTENALQAEVKAWQAIGIRFELK